MRNKAQQSVSDIDPATAHHRARQAWVALVRRHAPQLLQPGSAPSPMTWQRAAAQGAPSDIIKAREPGHRWRRPLRRQATPSSPSEHRRFRASLSREALFATPRRGSPASLEFDSMPSRNEPLFDPVTDRESAAGHGEKSRRWAGVEPVASACEAQGSTVPEPIQPPGGVPLPTMSEAAETRRSPIGANQPIPLSPHLRHPHVRQSESPRKPVASNVSSGDPESELAPPRCTEPGEAPVREERQARWRAAPPRMPALLNAESSEMPSWPRSRPMSPQGAPQSRPALGEGMPSGRPYDPWPCLLADPVGEAGSSMPEQEIDGDRQRRLHNEQRGL